MYGSKVFTFAFLASSLIMLAAMPSLNQNNSFSNTAMTQGYNGIYEDSYYSKYPTDDKKYEYINWSIRRLLCRFSRIL